MEVTFPEQHELGKKRTKSQTNSALNDTQDSARYVPVLKRMKHTSLLSGADSELRNCGESNKLGLKHDASRTTTTDLSYPSGLDEEMIDNEEDLKLHLAGNANRNDLAILDKIFDFFKSFITLT